MLLNTLVIQTFPSTEIGSISHEILLSPTFQAFCPVLRLNIGETKHKTIYLVYFNPWGEQF
jgi:hypothetical protein